MQTFFELEELHPTDREWTSRGGNGKGAGSLSLSGKFIWKPADDGDDNENDPNDAVPNDQEGDSKGGSDGKDENCQSIVYAKARAKASAVGPATNDGGKRLTGEETGPAYGHKCSVCMCSSGVGGVRGRGRRRGRAPE